MTTPPILRQMRHDVWATDRLLEHCRSLGDARLALTATGTYGTIREILAHIVRADEGYLEGLGLLEGPRVEVGHSTTLDEIAAHLERVKGSIERLFSARGFDPDKRFHAPRWEATLEPWVLVAQFSHHGSDHRSQISTILSVNGLAAPAMDVWAYAEVEKAIVNDPK